MIFRCLQSIALIIIGCVLMASGSSFAQSGSDPYDYIDISNPFLRKIPLAIPLFKNETGTAEEARLSELSSDLLSASLEFTGYFKILDRQAFLFDPQSDGILAPQINFENWTVIGAELLITGLYEEDHGKTPRRRTHHHLRQHSIQRRRYYRNQAQRTRQKRYCPFL